MTEKDKTGMQTAIPKMNDFQRMINLPEAMMDENRWQKHYLSPV